MTKELPLISVVIPVYNSSNTIISTLESVKRQTFQNYQILVVNDGSKDDSLEKIDAFVNANPNLDIQVINQENSGVSCARNTALKRAQGHYIAFLDSDDEWRPQKIEKQLQVFNADPSIDFLGTTRNGEYFRNILWKRFGRLTKIGPKFLLVKFIFVVPTILFKANVLKDIGYFLENQKYAEEGNYFIRIANKYNCYLLNEDLVITGGGKAHFGFSGLSGNVKEMEKGELKNIRFAYHTGVINYVEFLLVSLFSLMKYARRLLIVKFLR